MKAASGKAGIAAYANAYIEATEHKVTVICGDGSIELSANLTDCDTQQDGIICVDAQKLLQAFTACKFDCTVFIKDGFAEVKSVFLRSKSTKSFYLYISWYGRTSAKIP